MPLYISLQKI